MKNYYLRDGETTFKQTKRGLMVTAVGEHRVTRFFIPRVNVVSELSYQGSPNVEVQFGNTMKLHMTTTMWNTHENNIIAAAMGEDAV